MIEFWEVCPNEAFRLVPLCDGIISAIVLVPTLLEKHARHSLGMANAIGFLEANR